MAAAAVDSGADMSDMTDRNESAEKQVLTVLFDGLKMHRKCLPDARITAFVKAAADDPKEALALKDRLTEVIERVYVDLEVGRRIAGRIEIEVFIETEDTLTTLRADLGYPVVKNPDGGPA